MLDRIEEEGWSNGECRRRSGVRGFEILGVCGAAEGPKCPSRPLEKGAFGSGVRVDALINREWTGAREEWVPGNQ
jgi:hypothetical protein